MSYTDEEQKTIEALIECQTHLKLADKPFAEGWIKTYSEATWSKMRRGVYEAKDQSKVFAGLHEALLSIRRRIARLAAATQGGKFYEFDQFKAIFAAVQECLHKKGQNRLIFFVAPTGAGKSRFIAELEARTETAALNAHVSWHSSYYFAALDVLAALNRSGKFGSAGDAHREMVAAMKGRVQVLAIDEGNYFGPKSISLVKDVLNETEWTVVVCLTPGDFNKMRRHFTEWSQLQRRIHQVFFWQPLAVAEVRLVLGEAGLNGDAQPAAVALARAANEFGGMDFVSRVVERLEESAPGPHPALADVEAAIRFVQKQIALNQDGGAK